MKTEPTAPLPLPQLQYLAAAPPFIAPGEDWASIVSRTLASSTSALGLVGCAFCGPETGALGCVECAAAIIDTVLNALGIGVLDDLIAALLDLFGLSGRPREAVTEQVGNLLRLSPNWRVYQLGTSILLGSSLVGRIISSTHDNQHFFTPAINATNEWLFGPPAKWGKAEKFLADDLVVTIYAGSHAPADIAAWSSIYRDYENPTKRKGAWNDGRDLVPEDVYHGGAYYPRRADLPVATLIQQLATLSKPLLAKQPHAKFDDVLNVVVVLQAQVYNYNVRWIWQQDHKHYLELHKWWTDQGHADGPGPGPTPTPGHIPPPPPNPGPNPDPEEHFWWYKEQYEYYLALAAQAIEATFAQQVQINQHCCRDMMAGVVSLVDAITAGANTQAAAATGIAHKLDLAPLAKSIEDLAKALENGHAGDKKCCDEVVAVLTRIAAAEEKPQSVDLKPIVDAIDKFAKIVDVPLPVLEQLAKDGFITHAELQTLGAGEFGSSLVSIFRRWGWDAWVWIASWAGGTYTGKGWVVKPTTSALLDDLLRGLDDMLTYGSEPVYPVLKKILEAVVEQLQPTRLTHIADTGIDPDLLLAKTLVPLMLVNGYMLLADFFGWEISEQLKQYTEWGTALVGFDEIKELKVGALMRFGPVREAEMRAKQIYQQELPGTSQLNDLAARGLIPASDAERWAIFNGTPHQIRPQMRAGAYGGLNPRMMLRLVDTGLFTQHDLADEFTFSGIRPTTQHRMLVAAPYLSTEPERKQLRATHEKAYVDGFLDDARLVQELDAAEHDTDRNSLILSRVRIEKRVAIAKLLETEYSDLYRGNLIDLTTYRGNLEGLGLQPDAINARLARDEARSAVTLARKEAAAAAALVRATELEARKVAMRNYLQGNIDAAGLALALEATGLTHLQTAAWVDMALLQKQGEPKWFLGLRLDPFAAQLLKDRVKALEDQRKRLLITDAVYTEQLQDLGIPVNYINALRAAADALVTPRKSATVVTVETA